ncbi:hypothetical protein PMZ80_007649 [Knufia obscura]|uniref:Dienelactone hydrolase domain-containing protein n=2 Tax=Knufia TaxID=430999 RepID=A0AAN8EF51_9EURO|nr:hypothetical protein PMZ80_007649 [Knufia obscura]KAK5954189.1 hypothetical protein OHC33_004762 [Knufia fluminis]
MATNVGMSSCCLSGQLHNHATPTGSVKTIGDLSTYVAEPSPDQNINPKTLIFLVDIFGYELPNTRLLADEYAKQGFLVYVPDILQGDPLPISFLQNVEPPLKDQEQAGLIDKTKNTAIVGATLGTWLPKHREAVTLPIVEKFVDDVKKTATGKVGTIGFCFGGRYSILMAHGKVDAAYACHPSLVAIPGDFEPVTKPLSLAVGTKDSLLSDEQNDQIKEILDKNSVPTELVKYQDQIHGFSLRGDWSSDKDKKAQDDALKQGVAWFNEHLK